MTDPKPMDPERLAKLRMSARNNNMSNGAWIRELLDDRDHWAGEMGRFQRKLTEECRLSDDRARRADLFASEIEAFTKRIAELESYRDRLLASGHTTETVR